MWGLTDERFQVNGMLGEQMILALGIETGRLRFETLLKDPAKLIITWACSISHSQTPVGWKGCVIVRGLFDNLN